MNAPHYPDGLTEEVIDRLLAEVDASVKPVRRPTSPFALRPLDLRRERRQVTRNAVRIVRELQQQRVAFPGRAA
ncbi:hypothetical protein [Actinokineospora fastidiosa]|uniref:Uncharacterized protein n=1 Tax=Actinokineospora fastidiosa TaxID=1816 RepID=A0A918GUN7_9PSEU|nr:hypothetical protein [Actinokineospora fastidiosa]GGS61349.1 hypothetical protein GCM10010171_65180 [Actinokineospora fastidiosa]